MLLKGGAALANGVVKIISGYLFLAVWLKDYINNMVAFLIDGFYYFIK